MSDKIESAATADDLTTGAKVTKGKATKGATAKATNKKATGGGKAPAKSATTKAAAKAPAKSAAKPKADPKPKQKKATSEANRQSYAGRKITVLVKFADANLREGTGRAARYAAIAKAKNTDDVLGKEVTDGAGNVSAIGGNHIAFFVANDFISLS